MNKLNVGDYVRTEDYGIRKITSFISDIENDYICCDDENNRILINKKDIIKSAEGTPRGLLSLIEVGDIVNYEQLNGGVVLNKKENSIDTWSILPNSLKNEDIKSVITKEQLKNNMYEVGE